MDINILEKIRKLLTLSQDKGATEAEAKLAAERANELLLRHNLSLQDVGEAAPKKKYQEHQLTNRTKRLDMEAYYVSRIIKEHFLVVIFITGNRYSGKCFCIMGEETNVAIAKYTFGFLVHAYYRAWTEFKTQTGADRKAKHSYYEGLTRGISDQLRERKAKVEQETGLVLVKDTHLEQWKKDNLGGSYSMGGSASHDQEAAQAGYRTGKSMHLTAGVTSKGTSQPKQLK